MTGSLVGTSSRKEHAKSKCKMMNDRCTGIEESYLITGQIRYKVFELNILFTLTLMLLIMSATNFYISYCTVCKIL